MEKKVNIDLNKCPFEACKCGCIFWKERTVIKKISAIMAASFNDISQNVAFMACEKCGMPHPQTSLDWKVGKVMANYPEEKKETITSGESIPSSSDQGKIVSMTSSTDSSKS